MTENNKRRFEGELQTLDTRIDCIRGVSYKAAEDLRAELNANSLILLRANNIQGGELNYCDVQYVDKSKVKEKQLLRKGDILVCASSGSKGLVGKAALIKEDIPVTFGAFCCVIRPTCGESELLGHYFQSRQYRKAIEAACSGSNINNLKPRNFFSLEVPRYRKDVMKDIVSKLNAVDYETKQLRTQIAKLDALVKSRFIEMFGDPVVNSLSLPTAQWSTVLSIKNGKNQKAVETPEGNYPICGSGGEIGRASSYITKEDSVIIGRKGNINNPILMREPFWNVDTAFGLEPNESVLKVEYLFAFCEWFNFEQLNKAVTIPSLTKADLLKIEMPLPPINSQQEFADFVTQVDKLRFDIQQQIEKLETLKQSLMQEYFG